MVSMEHTASEVHDGYIWKEQHCPICNAAPTRFIGSRGGTSHREGLGVETDIWECGGCELIFPNPMPIPERGLGQHYGMEADDYFAHHDVDNRLNGASEMLAMAEKLLGRKGKLLDIGVGRGENLMAAIAAGWDCEGVEPSETFADHVEQISGTKIWRSAIEDCDIEPETFDIVILSAVLEHLYDPDLVIKKIAKILRPGGFVMLDVPNEKGLFFKAGNLYQKARGRRWCVNLAPTFSPFHVFGFSPRSLRKLLAKHGLEPKVWEVFGGTSLVPSSGGLMGKVESVGSRAITRLSDLGEMGTYIQTWAQKK